MKITKALTIPALLAALTIVSCTDKDEKKSNDNSDSRQVELESFTYDLVGRMDADTLGADSLRNYRITGDIVLPEEIGKNDITQLRDSLMRLANVQMQKHDKLTPVMPEGVSLSDLDAKKVSTPSISANSLSIDLLTPELIVWENYSYDYEVFMAHGVSTTTYVNYSIRQNKILSLADLLKPGYEKQLLPMLRDAVKAQLGNNLLVEIDEVQIPDNFRIKANGIEFIYGSTSIAPSSEGEVNVKLSIMDLEGLLTPEAVHLILGSQNS